MASDPEARTFHDAESSSGEHCADENDRIDEGFEDIRQDEALLALEQEYLVLSSILPLHRAKALASSPDALCGSATHGGEAFRAGGGTDAMYGEMGFWAMASILRAVELHGGLPATPGDFVDLGSGSGLAVAAAGLLRPHAWGRLRGVENSAPLHAASLGVAEAYAARRPRPAAPDLELEEGDAAQVSLEGATLVLAHCTAFSDALLHAIALQAAAMRPGAWVVTLTRPLPVAAASGWDIIEARRRTVSWGAATVFLHRRRLPDAGPPTCTRVAEGTTAEAVADDADPSYRSQVWFNCRSCGLIGSDGICAICASICHAKCEGLEFAAHSPFFCDCEGSRVSSSACQCREQSCSS